MRLAILILLGSTAASVLAQMPSQVTKSKQDLYGTSSCVGCHGVNAMGGLGPPIAQTKLDEPKFLEVVRKGKGMMPATPITQMPDHEVKALRKELLGKEWRPEEIPIAYKVGMLLTTRNVGLMFFAIFGIATLLAIKVWWYWVRLAGLSYMMPAIRRFGIGRSALVVLRSLVIDGLLVAQLWRKDKFRWAMHGMMLYGMFGLLAADILIQIYNPARAQLNLVSPLKLLPMVSGILVLTGVLYVLWRYKTDEYIDNGLTLNRDYVFVTLLFHTVLSGFLTVVFKRSTAYDWVMPIYLYHLLSIAALVLTAPFTRFQHAWIVPTMVALTRLTEAITAAGLDLGFLREPSPGRHHKSRRIAEDVIRRVAPHLARQVRLRYYP